MSQRYPGGFITASYNGLKIPNAPTIGTVSQVTSTSVSVTFIPPWCAGASAITSYVVKSTPGCITGTGSSSPVTVSGVTTGTSYTYKVAAVNAYGSSVCSAASSPFTTIAIGQQAYTTAGTYTWVAPAAVTSVSLVAIGGGAYGGGGGGLTYKNNQTVTPGASYTVVVGAGGANSDGGNSSFNTTIIAGGGLKAIMRYISGCYQYAGPGGGGSGGTATYGGGGVYQGGCATGGGGAGGYTQGGGNGGNPYFSYCCCTQIPGNGGDAGNAGNSGGYGGAGIYCWPTRAGGGGGGQGIYGLGLGASFRGTNGGNGAAYSPGGGGLYGGGGGQGGGSCSAGGTRGAVRIIWPGTTRQFPSTCTGDK